MHKSINASAQSQETIGEAYFERGGGQSSLASSGPVSLCRNTRDRVDPRHTCVYGYDMVYKPKQARSVQQDPWRKVWVEITCRARGRLGPAEAGGQAGAATGSRVDIDALHHLRSALNFILYVQLSDFSGCTMENHWAINANCFFQIFLTRGSISEIREGDLINEEA